MFIVWDMLNIQQTKKQKGECNMAIRISSRAVIVNDGKILLNVMGDGIYYNFPGGQIEETETAPEAVVREVFEETGYNIRVEDYLFTSEYEANHCNGYEGTMHRVQLFFKCELVNENRQELPMEPDVDYSDLSVKSKPVWIPLSELEEISFVPAAIRGPLIKYLDSGIFEPKYIECSQYNSEI